MPTRIEASSQVNVNIPSTDADESLVMPFSMVDLLGTRGENHIDAKVTVDLTFQEDASQESTDDADESHGSEWLAYWNMAPITMPEESLPAQEQINQIGQNGAYASDDVRLVNPLTNASLDGSVLKEAYPIQVASETSLSIEQDHSGDRLKGPQPMMQQAIESQVLTMSLPSREEVPGSQPLVSALLDNTTLSVSQAPELMTAQSGLLEINAMATKAVEVRPVLTDIISPKLQLPIEEEDRTIQSNQRFEKQMLETVSVQQQSPIVAAINQLPPFMLTDKADVAETMAPDAADENTSAISTMQLLTDSLNEFLRQDLGTVQIAANDQTLQSQKPAFDAQRQMTMELMSMQREPLVDSVGVNLEQYTAQIKVHPQELGQITATIEINQGVATISFLTERAHVKQLLEANLPELRQAFGHSSLNLNDVDVRHGDSNDKKDSPVYANRDDEEDGFLNTVVNKGTDFYSVKTNRSIIDTYA